MKTSVLHAMIFSLFTLRYVTLRHLNVSSLMFVY